MRAFARRIVGQEAADDMQILAGKILVDEEKVHLSAWPCRRAGAWA